MTIPTYIQQILSAIEGTPDELKELHLELTDYLQDKQSTYLKKGLSEEQATQQTMATFGDPKKIGSDLAQTLFPQRKWFLNLMLWLSILSFMIALLFSIFQKHPTPVIWFVLYSSTIFLTYKFNRQKLWITRHRLLFIFHCIFCALLTWHPVSIVQYSFERFGYFYTTGCLLIFMANILLGALYKPVQKNFAALPSSSRLTIILANTLSAFVVFSYATLILLGLLLFGPAQNNWLFFARPIVCIVLWIIGLKLNNALSKTYAMGILFQILASLIAIHFYIMISP
ncbi:permease prefix domain 1-containing protein [Enterococcus olivae]